MSMDTCQGEDILYRSIGDVVDNHWDPLNMSDSNNTSNSYEKYMPLIYKWALTAKAKEDLMDGLGNLACKQLGVATNLHNDRRAADLIIAIRDFHFKNKPQLKTQMSLKLSA